MPYQQRGNSSKSTTPKTNPANSPLREFVIEVPDGNYPQYVKFQAVQDR